MKNNSVDPSVINQTDVSKPPELHYPDYSSALPIFSVLSDDASLRLEIEVAKKEDPLHWTEHVLNNFHNRFPGGYKWENFVEGDMKGSLDGEKFKRDLEDVVKSLHTRKSVLAASVDRREHLLAMIHNYEENFQNQKEWYDRRMAAYASSGLVSPSDLRKQPKQLYLAQIESIKKISDQRADVYIGMRKKGYSHKELCQ